MSDYVFVVMAIVIAAISLTFLVRLDRKNRQKRDEQDRQEAADLMFKSIERMVEQDERGERLFLAVKAANDNRPSKSWQVRVGRIRNNAGAYSVIVQKRDPDGTAVGCGMQFDVHQDKLRYFLNFQEAGDMAPAEFEQFLELATSRVSAIA